MTGTEHMTAWLDRCGSAYATERERAAAYRDHQDALAELRSIIFQDDAAAAGKRGDR